MQVPDVGCMDDLADIVWPTLAHFWGVLCGRSLTTQRVQNRMRRRDPPTPIEVLS